MAALLRSAAICNTSRLIEPIIYILEKPALPYNCFHEKSSHS